jgi:hypothetical protein
MFGQRNVIIIIPKHTPGSADSNLPQGGGQVLGPDLNCSESIAVARRPTARNP